MKQTVQVGYLSSMDQSFDDRLGVSPIHTVAEGVDVKLADIVVIDRGASSQGSLSIGIVKDIHDEPIEVDKHDTVHPILDVITDNCEALQEKSDSLRKKIIKKKMDERIKKMDALISYRQYAKDDPVMEEMLKEFEALDEEEE